MGLISIRNLFLIVLFFACNLVGVGNTLTVCKNCSLKTISEAIGLQNVKATHSRVEAIDDTYDFVVSRAVTSMPDFVKWVRKKVAKKHNFDFNNEFRTNKY